MSSLSSQVARRSDALASRQVQLLTESAAALPQTTAAISSLEAAIRMPMGADTLRGCINDMVGKAARAALPFVTPEREVAQAWMHLTRGGELTSVLASVQSHGMLLGESLERHRDLNVDATRTRSSLAALSTANARLGDLLQDGSLLRDIRALATTIEQQKATEPATSPSLLDLVLGRVRE